ncbi:hypothetical protein MCEMIH16_00865 [Caulobacteraceae bacterium]|jgi:hypothetical protein
MMWAILSIISTLIIGVGIPIWLAWKDGLLKK